MYDAGMTDSADIIRADNLSKAYKTGKITVPAVRSATFSIRSGEHIALMGPSGSGKSTLLNLLGGLDRPSAGTLVVSQIDLVTMKDKAAAKYRQSTVGMIFQSFNLLTHLTAEQNVMLPAILAGQSRSSARKRADELFTQVGLQELKQRRPVELSGGEQQRVAIVRALMNSPKVLLADEPTGNLDTASGEKVMSALLDATKETTLIVVTHDDRIAKRMERTLTIVDGTLHANIPAS